MWVKSFQVRNYKSFRDSGVIILERNINVLVGQNHVGKTALLNALALRMVGVPHRSPMQARNEAINPISVVDFDFVVSGVEVRNAILRDNMNVSIPIPRDWTQASKEEALNIFLELPEITFSVRGQSEVAGILNWSQPKHPSNNLYAAGEAQNNAFIQVTARPEKNGFHIAQMSRGENDNIGLHFASVLKSQIYYFDAQRTPQNSYSFGSAIQLASDATNLAQLLNILQANRTEFAEYVAQVRRVIPLIKWISVVPSLQHSNHVEIRVWNVEESTGRDDLIIPLAECGTGVGQVLSILYIILKSKGNIIVIDEPNSFLHPRAAKVLISILRQDNNNQYIISTHAPEIIAAAEPDKFFMLSYSDDQTSIKGVAHDDLESAQQVLEELGSSFSDVFGADQVLWVEGPTEVGCFPILLAAAGRRLGAGVVCAPLRSTGDLEGRHGAIVADIYKNLSTARSVLPPSLGLSLDGDKREMANQEQLRRAFGRLSFLPRRCYENYLLHPPAIAAILNNLAGFVERQTTETDVSVWIQNHGRDREFRAQEFEPFSDEWIVNVDAPRLLDDLFQSLSEAREIYRKPLHSVELTRWLLSNARGAVSELVSYVEGLLPACDR